jgi:hypothetical protein
LHQRQSNFAIPVGHKGKNFSSHFKSYNFTIHAVNFFETFCTCFPSSLGQDPTLKAQESKNNSFGFLKLEMADLRYFLKKKSLGPFGVKIPKDEEIVRNIVGIATKTNVILSSSIILDMLVGTTLIFVPFMLLTAPNIPNTVGSKL